jgi:DMSO reductase iron-sulfur subunit
MVNSFLFDMNKCTGCGACRLACTIENRLDLQKSWRRVDTFNERRLPAAEVFHHSVACNHCIDAPCMKACPSKAIRRDKDTGAVILDDGLCIGCRYCSWACPYDAPRFDEKNGVMTKCTLCAHRLEEGLEPACTSQCPTGALGFGDVKEQELVHEVKGYPATGIKPQVKIEPLRGDDPAPELTAPAEVEFFDPIRDLPPSKISLQSEWPLVVFTFLAALGVAFVYASLSRSVAVSGVAFTITAAATLGLSVVHLGRKERAPRAVLNLARSWLSREILLTTLFAGLSALYLLFLPPGHALGWIAAIVGFMALYSIDWVYAVTLDIGPGGLHSAGALLTGLFLTSIFIDSTVLILVFGALKFFLYVKRKLHFVKTGHSTLPLVSALRLILGFLIPSILWADSPDAVGVTVAFILAGELVDRCEYYDELEVLTPIKKMAADLKAMLSDIKE